MIELERIYEKLRERWIDMATLAVDNAECAAQLEIKDEELRKSLIRNISIQMQNAYEMNA